MLPPDEPIQLGERENEHGRTVADVLGPLLQPEALRGPILVVAAHPDDEVLGASWLLRHGPGCHVVHVTDGAPRDASLRAPDAPHTREAYARLREREALAALALAGVPPNHLFSLGAADQEATQHLVTLTQCLVALLKALRPTLLVVHPYEGGHPDHDAAAFVSHAAVALMARSGRTPPALLEMTSYHRRQEARVTGDFLPAPDGRLVATVSFTEAEHAAKRRMLTCHASQARLLETFSVEQERYRAAPRYDFTRPPHKGTLQYETHEWRMTGTRWRELARQALEELKLPEAPWH
ncbi:PIG-L family deacetylase [Archangium violaceum]|uniref:PIG-L deacetylase family protein n=1 Tax=Archangium violaceum TaxID=83451 RepID=UPI00193B770D|nr:PIG-L family deacetylase [Archangium violaceum]QRK12355.1 PIG-L family deacetylase [Archangium violaceum]